MPINKATLAAAEDYTDAQLDEHVVAPNPHPGYVRAVNTAGASIPSVKVIFGAAGEQPPRPPIANSLFVSPSGLWTPNETATSWVQLGVGVIAEDITAPTAPGGLRVTATTQTTISVAWNASTDTETGVGGYDVQLDSGLWVSLGNVLAYTFTGMAAGSSHTLRVRARDNATVPNISSTVSIAGTTTAAPVTSPQNLRVTATTPTSVTFAWDAPTSGTVTGYQWRLDGGTFASNGTATTKTITGLVANTLHTFGVEAVGPLGASAEVTISARTATTTGGGGGGTPAPTLMGVSTTATSTHGGLTWDGWRAYNLSALTNDAKKTPQPKFIAYSESGTPLGGSYATILAHCRSVLDTFYYGGTGQGRSANWGIKLYWSNGNENYTAAKIPSVANYVESMRALYDACHYVDPVTGSRRYPDAYAGSNPTTGQEQSGAVQAALHPSARYHDFVMWSMYPLDLGNDGQEVTFDWPSFVESDRTDSKLGFLLRCFYRTKQAEAQARADRGDPTYRIGIGSGETGATRSPSDPTTRPYWAAMAMWGGAQKLAAQYDLDLPFLCWWDDTVANRNTSFGTDVTGTNPSTAKAWHDAASYNPEFGGTKPAAWSTNPKPGWRTSGPVV